MRIGLWSLIGMIGVLALAAQDGTNKTPAKRFNIETDSKSYPQTTPNEALASLLKAVGAKRVDYVLAQLADPDWVDRRVQETGGGFRALVEESTTALVGNPMAVKRLKKLSTDGEWKIDGTEARVRLKDMEDVVLFFHKIGERWFVENRKK